jgi:flagellar motor switch protein FliM
VTAESITDYERASLLGTCSPPAEQNHLAEAAPGAGRFPFVSRPDAAVPGEQQEVDLKNAGRGESISRLPVPLDVQFTLQSVTEEFCERLSAAWKESLQLATQVQIDSVAADTYAAFVLSRPLPTCFHVFSIAPLEGRLLIEFPLPTFFSLLEWLLGKRDEGSSPPARTLTTLERHVAQWLTADVLTCFAGAWDSFVSLSPQWERTETNARVVRCMPASEVLLVVAVRFSIHSCPALFRIGVPLGPSVRACLGDY